MIETCSVAMRLGMADIWTWLRGEGLRLAVCSNLSSDHVAALRDTLPGQPEVLSCKVGAIKPEPAIYARVDGLQIKVDKVLFPPQMNIPATATPTAKSGQLEPSHQTSPPATRMPPFAAKSFQLNVFAARTLTSGSSILFRSQTQITFTMAAITDITIINPPSGSDPA